MFFIASHLKCEGSIVAIGCYEDRIILVNNAYTLFHYDRSYKPLGKQTYLAKQEPLHRYSKALSFSPVEKLFFSPYGVHPIGILCDVSQGTKVLAKSDEHHTTIEISRFSPQGNYIAVGNASGRTLLFDIPSRHYLTETLPRPDYTSSVCFSDHERYVVNSSFELSTSIFDITLNKQIRTLRTADIVEDSCFFDDNNAIALIMRNGSLQVFHINENRLDAPRNIFPAWPTSIILCADQSHFIVGLKNGHICAVKIATMELVFDETLSSVGITCLRFFEGLLIVGREAQESMIIQTDHLVQEFEAALRLKEHDKLDGLIAQNIFLSLNEHFDTEMIELYEPLFKQVYTLVEQGNVEQARTLVSAYANDPKIMNKFERIVQGSTHIQKLAELVQSQQIFDAFGLINKYPNLRDTPAALKLERYWSQTFNQAKLLCASKDVMKYKQAVALLKPFEKVPEKQLIIHTLLKNIQLYIQADALLKTKNFSDYFALVKKNPILGENDTHKRLIEVSRDKLKQLKAMIKRDEITPARELIAFLAPFETIKEELHKLSDALQARVAFFEAVRTNDLPRVYELAKSHIELRELPQYQTIEQTFKTLSKQALDYAFKADAFSVKQLLLPYINIDLFIDKIASIMKIAFLNEMKQHAKKPDIDWVALFKRYIALFGKNEELIHTAAQIEKTKELESFEAEPDAFGYKKHELPHTILKAL